MATLALNIITYEQDSEELKRCLESCKGILFDERIIVDTTKEASTAILDLCQQYDCKYFHFPWCDNFSAARNYALDNTSTAYMLWLDSDDIIKPKEYTRILQLKETLEQHEQYLLDYVYASDENDKALLVLPRERINKICPEIRWHDPIHECMNLTNNIARLNIAIHHYRKKVTQERNTKLLEKAYNNNPSERIKFYYAKELFEGTTDTTQKEKAVKIFEDYLETSIGKDSIDNEAHACHSLAKYYSYIDINRALYYAYKSISFSPLYAESYYFLGLFNEYKNSLAFDYYKLALTKTTNAGLGQAIDYYRYYPARQLAFLNAAKGNMQEARKYAALATISKTDNELELLIKKIGKTEIKPLWLCQGNIDLTNGSFRIRRWQLHTKIQDSLVLENYSILPYAELISHFEQHNVVIFMNFSVLDLGLMLLLRNMHKVVIFDHCENIWGFQWQHECMQLATLITACSTVLAEETYKRGYQNVIVIPDAIEQPEQIKQNYSTTKLKAGFFGMGGNSWLVTSWLKDTIEQAGYELVTCTEWEDATVKWNIDTWQDEMLKCDVILCPQRTDVQPAKSNNKVTQAMAMGLPVIASPLQAYKEVINHSKNGFIATTLEDWKNCLEQLKDETLRCTIGQAAKNAVEDYGLDKVTARWQEIMTEVLVKSTPEIKKDNNNNNEQTEIIDIIIPNYNNWLYLRLCLDSILLNTKEKYRIIISDAGSNKETWQELAQLKGFTILGTQDKRLTFSQACNAGIKISTSKYFVILNSDTIVSKNWLTNIINKMDTQGRLAACGVLSNCDLGWLHGVPGKPAYNMQVPLIEITGKKLNLGCGNKRIEGYTNVDIVKIPGAVDEIFDIAQIPYEDNTIAAISSEHALEHLPHEKTKQAIKEWYRVLQPGAELKLMIPDVELCMQGYLNGDNNKTINGYPEKTWYKMTLYGAQTPENGSDAEHQYHLTGFSKQEIKDLLETNGFIIKELKNYNGWGTPSIYINAIKPGGKNLNLHPGMKLEQVKPHLDALYKFMEESNLQNKDVFIEQTWVAAYATCYARSAIDEVGLFDEQYENGNEDIDLNKRLSAFGFKTGQAIDAFVFHFGGISRGAYQLENKEAYDEQDKNNHEKFKNKWAQKKIAIFTGPAWEPWDEEKVMQGMAGSETWAVYLAHAFAKKGYKIYIFNHRQDPDTIEEIDNVYYIDYRKMEEFLQYEAIDYFITSRTCGPLDLKIHSLNNYVMIHDIFLHQDTNYDIKLWKTRKYAYLSDWHKDFIIQHHRIPEDKLFKTANGIPKEYYDDVDNYTKKNQMVYSSSPDRGLYQLLQMLPSIRKEVPDFTLYVAYGFYNWETMAKQTGNQKSIEFITKIKTLMEQPGVVYLGRISKQELATYEKQSKVWLYPTWFTETFCITAATAGIAKCAILTTNLGGLQDTVGNAGILLPSTGLTRDVAYPEPYVAHFVSEAVKLLKDEEYRCSWATKAYNKMQQYNWESIANNWINLFNRDNYV